MKTFRINLKTKRRRREKLAQAEETSSSGICASCGKLVLRGQSKGPRGEQNRAENEQIQRQRKESKGSSEVRRQRHCVETTITAAPTEPECRPAPTAPPTENTALKTGLQQSVCLRVGHHCLTATINCSVTSSEHFGRTCTEINYSADKFRRHDCSNNNI